MVAEEFDLRLTLADGALTLFFYNMPPRSAEKDWNTDRHCHALYELHAVLEGRAEVDVEGNAFFLSSQEALLLPPKHYHKAKNLSAGGLSRVSLLFSVAESPMAEALLSAAAPCRKIALDSEAFSLLQSLLRKQEDPNFFKDRFRCLLSLFLIKLFKTFFLPEKKPSASKETVSQNIYTTLIDDYFERHLADGGSEAELSALLFISTRQLYRVLKKEYGMSFRQKLLSARMDYAAYLLRTTQRQVTEICRNLGYSSEAAFYKNFKAHFGMTPKAYRKRQRG